MDKNVADMRRKALDEQMTAEKERITSRYERQIEAMKNRMSRELASVDQRFENQAAQLERATRVAGNVVSKSVH